MFIYLHVIRLYWKWHTCIPYALKHPRTIGVSEMSLEKMVRRVVYIINYRRVVHKLKISIVEATQLIFIGG